MRDQRWMRRSAAVLSATLLLAACGGGEEDPAATESAVETDTTSETESASASPSATESGSEAAVTDATDGSLQLAYILPETGQLAFLGPPMITAVQLAVEDINAAGGVLGSDVSLSTGDEAGDASVASQTATRLLGEGVDAVIGAASSGMSLSFIDQVTGNGVLQCSPSNTSPTFTDYDDNGLYFRTAPTDALQGPVLANLVISDGFSSPAILFRNDDYGAGLADAVETTLSDNGASASASIGYDPEAPNFDAEVSQALESGADSVVIIGFDEAAQIIATMIENGAGPDAVAIYGADGMAGADFPEQVDPNNPGVLEGMKGTSPAPGGSEEFQTRLTEASGGEDALFGAESYDCATLIALAAQSAQSDEGSDIAAAMLEVSSEGTECTSFEECLPLLEEGEDIDYQGVSGNADLTEAGEPAEGTYQVYEFQGDGSIETVSTETSTLDGSSNEG